MELKQGPTIIKSIDWVKPYWRNPRRVPEEAVNALAESIKSYGYQQPIVVDTEGMIIIGHTRYAAMRKLGVTEIPVQIADYLTPKEIKQLRVVDNRVAEMTSWDLDTLSAELSDLDGSLLRGFFPEMTVDEDWLDDEDGTVTVTEDPSDVWDDLDDQVEFVCPSCFHSWQTQVTRENILSGKIEEKP